MNIEHFRRFLGWLGLRPGQRGFSQPLQKNLLLQKLGLGIEIRVALANQPSRHQPRRGRFGRFRVGDRRAIELVGGSRRFAGAFEQGSDLHGELEGFLARIELRGGRLGLLELLDGRLEFIRRDGLAGLDAKQLQRGHRGIGLGSLARFEAGVRHEHRIDPLLPVASEAIGDLFAECEDPLRIERIGVALDQDSKVFESQLGSLLPASGSCHPGLGTPPILRASCAADGQRRCADPPCLGLWIRVGCQGDPKFIEAFEDRAVATELEFRLGLGQRQERSMGPVRRKPTRGAIDRAEHLRCSRDLFVALGRIALRALVQQIGTQQLQLATQIENLTCGDLVGTGLIPALPVGS